MDLTAWLGGISYWLLGSLGCICTPHEASPAFLMDEVTLSVSLPLPGALHGTDQLSIPSVLWSGIMRVVCLVLAGFHPKGLPREVFLPGSAWIWGEGWLEGQGEQADAVQAPCTGVVVVEDCHKHIHGCCLQFSHSAGEDVAVKGWGAVLVLARVVNFLHRKYSPIQATVNKINSTLAKTSTGAYERSSQAVSQSQFILQLHHGPSSGCPTPLGASSSGPLQRVVQCLAGAKGSQHTQLYQPPLPGDSVGAAEL